MIPKRLWLFFLLWVLASCQNQADHSQVNNAILYVHRTTTENNLVLHCLPTGEEVTLFVATEYGFVGIPRWSSAVDNIFVEAASGLSMAQLLRIEPDKSSFVSDVLSINQPEISPNNDIVFSGIPLTIARNPDIYTLSQTNTLARITNDAVPNSSPSWSSDANTLVFQSLQEDDTTHWDIIEYDVQTKVFQTLSASDTHDVLPSYSPDNRYLAYVKKTNEQYQLTILQNSDNSLLHTIPLERELLHYVWSPSGQEIVVVLGDKDSSNPYLLDVDTQNLQQLTFTQDVRNYVLGWSANGEKIAFQSDITGEFKVYVMDVASKAVETVSNREGIQEFPIWARKGKFLERLSCE